MSPGKAVYQFLEVYGLDGAHVVTLTCSCGMWLLSIPCQCHTNHILPMFQQMLFTYGGMWSPQIINFQCFKAYQYVSFTQTIHFQCFRLDLWKIHSLLKLTQHGGLWWSLAWSLKDLHKLTQYKRSLISS